MPGFAMVLGLTLGIFTLLLQWIMTPLPFLTPLPFPFALLTGLLETHFWQKLWQKLSGRDSSFGGYLNNAKRGLPLSGSS